MDFLKILIIIALTVPNVGFGQQTISGKVLSTAEEPLIGATVKVFNSAKGAITDVDGKFQIEGVKLNDKLVISFVGYLPDTISVSQNQEYIIRLAEDTEKLDEIIVEGQSTSIDELKPVLSELISEKELLKAACCNLSESFETNASVDVSFADAITGAKTIRMLGLDGRYVLISREGIPHIRGLNSKYGLTYVPGTWIQSIDVGKGAGTVINGFESMTGQINVELKKPESSEKWYLNAYANSFGRFEFNANYATELNDKWSTAILLNTQYLGNEVDNNDDGFMICQNPE